jgi:hypothetical protein
VWGAFVGQLKSGIEPDVQQNGKSAEDQNEKQKFQRADPP